MSACHTGQLLHWRDKLYSGALLEVSEFRMLPCNTLADLSLTAALQDAHQQGSSACRNIARRYADCHIMLTWVPAHHTSSGGPAQIFPYNKPTYSPTSGPGGQHTCF